jgi:hypothetical protein
VQPNTGKKKEGEMRVDDRRDEDVRRERLRQIEKEK